MIIIIGLVILVAAVIVGVAGVLSNSGSGHALTHTFAVFGYHVTGSTGTLSCLRAEGPADQATGNIKRAGAKIEDASGH